MAQCIHCEHATAPAREGIVDCGSSEARRALGDGTIGQCRAGGENGYPFFEDNMLPW